jgi:hypothetical protein
MVQQVLAAGRYRTAALNVQASNNGRLGTRCYPWAKTHQLANPRVMPGATMGFAMELILAPIIQDMIANKNK